MPPIVTKSLLLLIASIPGPIPLPVDPIPSLPFSLSLALSNIISQGFTIEQSLSINNTSFSLYGNPLLLRSSDSLARTSKSHINCPVNI